MRNQKGFTLAELLGVLTILAIIALITVPLVNKYITSSRQKAYDAEMKTLKTAAQQWFVKNSTSIEWSETGYYALNLDDLKQSEFLADEAIYNPLSPDEEITGCIMIIKGDEKYSYEFSETCTIADYVFDFTGSVQSVTLSSGTYKLEVWGAQGGYYSNSTYGGKGGYSVGTYTLATTTTLYVYVGGQGSIATSYGVRTLGGWNAGGSGSSDSDDGGVYAGGGGGATDISTTSATVTYNSSTYRYERSTYAGRLIVAGGGGGGGYYGGNYSTGGYGGGYIGGNGTALNGYFGRGGTQTTYGLYSDDGCGGTLAGLGFGGSYTGEVADACSTTGGGAGYYGGSYGSDYGGGAGGGSGYIGGVSSSAGVTKAMYCYNCSTSSSADTLTYSTTNSSATATVNYAKLGNGYAKITRIS